MKVFTLQWVDNQLKRVEVPDIPNTGIIAKTSNGSDYFIKELDNGRLEILMISAGSVQSIAVVPYSGNVIQLGEIK